MKASKVDINMNDFPEGLEMLILQSIDIQNFTGKLKARKKTRWNGQYYHYSFT